MRGAAAEDLRPFIGSDFFLAPAGITGGILAGCLGKA